MTNEELKQSLTRAIIKAVQALVPDMVKEQVNKTIFSTQYVDLLKSEIRAYIKPAVMDEVTHLYREQELERNVSESADSMKELRVRRRKPVFETKNIPSDKLPGEIATKTLEAQEGLQQLLNYEGSISPEYNAVLDDIVDTINQIKDRAKRESDEEKYLQAADRIHSRQKN